MAALKGHGFNRAAKVTRFLEINPRDEVAFKSLFPSLIAVNPKSMHSRIERRFS
jgi:hypothetical protein